MPRTTIDLEPSVLRELKTRGEREGKSMGQVASELLATVLRETPEASTAEFAWVSRRMEALVDLEDNDAVQRALDET